MVAVVFVGLVAVGALGIDDIALVNRIAGVIHHVVRIVAILALHPRKVMDVGRQLLHLAAIGELERGVVGLGEPGVTQRDTPGA